MRKSAFELGYIDEKGLHTGAERDGKSSYGRYLGIQWALDQKVRREFLTETTAFTAARKERLCMVAQTELDAFVAAAKAFKQRLATAATFDQIYALWKSTRIEYSYAVDDPYSDAYRQQVLEVYRQLTEDDYVVGNELTSPKQSPEQFRVGYPWVSRNLEVIAQEMSKPLQVLRTLHDQGLAGGRLIEFGAGWGNLAIPLAKSGMAVTVVDIDEGFLERIAVIAAQEQLQITNIYGDFLKASEKPLEKRYDVAVFQAAFHHCLDFQKLLRQIGDNVLSESGSIVLVSEPVDPNLTFPWGLRYDGESLWAIMCNKWLELGFSESFFVDLFLREGFLLSKIPGIDGFVGAGWLANKGALGLPFENWIFSKEHYESFHLPDHQKGFGRFCRKKSTLPGLNNCPTRNYRLRLKNFGPQQLRATIGHGTNKACVSVKSQEISDIIVDANCDTLVLQSDTYVPHKFDNNGDTRELGLALIEVALA